MNKKWTAGLLLAAVLLLLAGCGGQSNAERLDSVTVKSAEDSVVYNAQSDGTALLTVDITYPVLAAESGENTVVDKLNEAFAQKAKTYQNDMVKEYATWAEDEYNKNATFNPYTFALSGGVIYNQEGKLTVIWNDDSYTGGAHGDTVREAATYDLNTGEKLSLGQLMDMDEQKAIDTAVQRYCGVIESEAGKESNPFFEGAAEYVKANPDKMNYYLSDEGPVVYFQLYEVAPYAAGIIEIVLGP